MRNKRTKLMEIEDFCTSIMMFCSGVVLTIFAIGEKVPVECTEWWEQCTELAPTLNGAVLIFAFLILILIAILSMIDRTPKKKVKKCVLCKQVKKHV